MQQTLFNLKTNETNFRFDGPGYEASFDKERLTGQMRRIYNYIKNGEWNTLDEIATATGDPHASISAQLRHLRKERFGEHIILKRFRGERLNGLWEYRFIENKGENR